jgi:hypothetical protein
LFAPCLSHLRFTSGTILQNKAQYLSLDGFPRGNLGILNVCAPNTPSEHILLWKALKASLLANIKWVIMGDWNMVLVLQGNSHVASRIACDAEQLAFAWLLRHLGVEDFFT